ncbi:hypothetical protein BTHER_11111 [Brochothrix thermosphacta DSM 20171 = FSL F6-1036]|nr:hypothetical protein BTHER_11111 [Brochothrix thermosphacta DSM 20171 = FSL F6-1036]
MSFYTYEYLMNESNLTNYVKYGLTIVILLFLSFVTFKYMRDKLQTKYRDLSIIFCLLFNIYYRHTIHGLFAGSK